MRLGYSTTPRGTMTAAFQMLFTVHRHAWVLGGMACRIASYISHPAFPLLHLTITSIRTRLRLPGQEMSVSLRCESQPPNELIPHAVRVLLSCMRLTPLATPKLTDCQAKPLRWLIKLSACLAKRHPLLGILASCALIQEGFHYITRDIHPRSNS